MRRVGLAGWLGFLLPLSAALSAGSASAQTLDTKAQAAILMEFETGAVLFQKGADDPIPPASMTKVMTSAVAFAAIKAGRLRLEDRFTISENAWRTGGAPSRTQSMFAALRSSVAVSDLLRGMIVQAGNDAAIAIAEGMVGSEGAFADLMGDTARRIGLTRSVFRNPSGLPHPEQVVTPRDMALLARHVISEYPDLYKIYAEKEFTWNKIRQFSRNTLLDGNSGVDGLQAGGTEQTGFGVVASAVRDGVRLIVVVHSAKSERERTDEARKLLDWGFRSFKRAQLFADGATIAEAAVFAGQKPTVGLRPRAPVDVMLPTGRERLSIVVDYRGPLAAPVAAGVEVGRLKILIAGQVATTAPLVTTEAVGKGDFPSRAVAGLRELLWGWW